MFAVKVSREVAYVDFNSSKLKANRAKQKNQELGLGPIQCSMMMFAILKLKFEVIEKLATTDPQNSKKNIVI